MVEQAPEQKKPYRYKSSFHYGQRRHLQTQKESSGSAEPQEEGTQRRFSCPDPELIENGKERRLLRRAEKFNGDPLPLNPDRDFKW